MTPISSVLSDFSYMIYLLVPFGFLLVWAIIGALRRRFLHPLSRFPGPAVASVTDAWKAYQVFMGDFEKNLLELHRKYGSLVRIGPNSLSVSHVTGVKTIYGAGRVFKKSPFYDAFMALRSNLFGVRDEEVHSARRKALSNGFSMQSVAQMEVFIDACLSKLIKRLDAAAESGEVIDLQRWISFFVMDVLGELAFSRSFGVLDSGDVKAMPPVKEHVLLATVSGHMPWTIKYVRKLLPYLPIASIQNLLEGRNKLRQMAIDSVNERLASNSNRKDLLGKLLEELKAGVDSKGRTLDIIDVQTEAFGFIVAGSHTTAASAAILFWYLIRNSEILQRLREELDAVPAPPDGTACYPFSSVSNLPYLQACIAENFRISPVFSMPLPRFVPLGGKVIAGEFIPEGTEVSISNHVLHHDPDVFGDNLETYVPERWLDPTYDKSSLLMPFGAGHRACIGRNIATTEIHKLVASLLERFDFEIVLEDPAEKALVMPEAKSFGVAEMESSLLVKVRRREGA